MNDNLFEIVRDTFSKLLLSFIGFLSIILLLSALLSCGRDDKANVNCINKGDQCHVNVEISQGTCSVQQENEGAQISCPDGTKAFIKNGDQGPSGIQGQVGQDGAIGVQGIAGQNGINGIDGKDGVDGSQIRAIVPCPTNNQPYAERLLCIDDTLYAVYNPNGTETRLSVVGPGRYRTTDGRNAVFDVIINCELRCIQ
jgi:hypothetical protein